MSEHMKLKAELDFLTAIERGEVVTQMTLKQRIGVSVGLINALLKRAVGKGYVKVRRAPYKRYAYYLTPQGFSEKSRLVAAYLESSIDFLRQARAQYADIFETSLRQGKGCFALAGAGELAEIAILSTLGQDVKNLIILDPVTERSDVSGVRVVRDLGGHDVDAIVMTDATNPQDSFEHLRRTYPDVSILWPALLRITPDRDELIRAHDEGRAA
ncbi:helix-turn-helix domain-containing protein [Micavibrio aeruginosavorus]|uniref:Transcriptional regulator, MarR family n=1 Tax=Micavibrio aeruginosavorus EPB TaxID=349215 RepID=M4VEI3_9BACT|nr:MarR family transcriptional regulator [Micavibrio aeruginosavorus]AGH97787.1 Transcriptional regulator, MarR family [Micavibrio aeruginosavorus EPB]